MTRPLKILAFVGSPRNEVSYTYKVMRQIEAAMNAIQPTEVEYVFLMRTGVGFCDGCLSCVNVGESACPEYDTIGPIAAKMDEADGLVLGASVHTFAVSGLMKNFVEYFMYKRNRPSFFRKKALVTCTASGGGHKGVLEFLQGTAQAWGCDVVSRLGISSSQMKKERYLKLVDERTREIAADFIQAINEDTLDEVKLPQLVNFRAMQIMTRAQKGSVNHAYWQERGWLEADYYTNAPIGSWAKLVANHIARKMRAAIRKGNVEPVR